ncbi:MAG TPA: AlpA family phage regulatory protein [Gammaproteobacteria bacterium]|jgi:predicted DNA-binding transcriptional regulator AlpA|nr:AlpA family phage regulatory protein [Gammaproteobacteria bacterium]
MNQQQRQGRKVRLSEVARITGLGGSTIQRLVQEGKFPKPQKLTMSDAPHSAAGWWDYQIYDYLEACPLSGEVEINSAPPVGPDAAPAIDSGEKRPHRTRAVVWAEYRAARKKADSAA